MKPESIKKVAEAICNAENGIDGDPIGVIIANSVQCEQTTETVTEVRAFMHKVCAQAAQAAIRAVMETDEVRGLVEAAKAVLACQHFDGISPLYWVATSSKGDGLNEVAPKLREALAALEAGHE